MKKARKPTAKSSKLEAHNFLPTLAKPAEMIGEYIAMQEHVQHGMVGSRRSWNHDYMIRL